MEQSVVAALQQSALGAGCSSQELTQLAQRLPMVELEPGEQLIQAGAVGDAAFVLLQGELDIIAPDGTWLDRDLPGALVGEQALLPGSTGHRNATVVAREHVRLLRVDAALFEELFAARSLRREQLEQDSDAKTRNRLGRLSTAFRHLLEASEQRSFAEGEGVYLEGDPADGLHLILAGRAEVVTEKGGAPVHLSTVYPGQCFGERATLQDTPRTASVVAREGLRTAFVPLAKARALHAEHEDLEAFLNTLLRSYELRRGALHQRTVFVDGLACIETAYVLEDGRELTALREPGGRYRLETAGAAPQKTLDLGAGTSVGLDGEHRIVVLEDRGSCEDIAGLQALALDGTPLSVKARRTLRKAAKAASLRAPDALICRCMGIERATLEAAVRGGACSLPALKDATGCATVCGGCVRTIEPIIQELAAVAPSPDETAPEPQLPATAAGARLPRMPRLIPWLGNFTLSRDPAGFQRRGHARLGPVFGAQLLGLDFVFIDPVERGELLAQVCGPAGEGGLAAPAAWSTLAGGLLGPELAAAVPDLGLPPGHRGVEGAVAEVLGASVAEDRGSALEEVVQDSVLAAVLAARGVALGGELDAVAAQLAVLESDHSALGLLMPVKTPAARRRLAAREALQEQLGPELLALLLATHRNASLAVVAAMVELAQRPAAVAAVREAADRSGALVACLREAVRLRGGGGVWRRAGEDVVLGGVQVPAGALVGAVGRGAADPAPFEPSAGATPVEVGPQQGLFDESFGQRDPALALPERVAVAVLGALVHGWDWDLVRAPRRWVCPIVPGMGRPEGGAVLRAARRGS